MNEDDARRWLEARWPASMDRLEHYVKLLRSAAGTQNLVAPSTLATIWARHLVDSAQLIAHVPAAWHHWADIGSGAGLPGLVVSILSGRSVTLVEPRRLRAEFLRECIAALDQREATVVQAKAESADIRGRVDVISARAVGSIDRVMTATTTFAGLSTVFVLPKGVTATADVANAQRSWHGRFHVEQSIVDPVSGIVIASEVRRR